MKVVASAREAPLVSVIVPCFNQEAYIGETLDSVMRSSYQNWECIVVDDGSTDGSKRVVLEYAAKEERIRCISQENAGVSAARNNAVAHASGTFILPLDADDLISPEYIGRAVRAFAERPGVRLVYCKARKFGVVNGDWNLPAYSHDALLWGNLIFCSAMFRKADFEQTQGYNPNMRHGLEDWDFWLSFLSPGDGVFCIEEVLFFYRIKTVSRTTEAKNHHLQCLRQIYRNHKDLYAPFVENIIEYHEMISYREKYEAIKKSFSYRIGRLLLTPFRAIKNAILRQNKRAAGS